MIKDYRRQYLDDYQVNLGEMMDYVVHDCGMDGDEYFSRFVFSNAARGLEDTNPKYIAGMSGVEIAADVLHQLSGCWDQPEPSPNMSRSKVYWAGWIIAYYQWHSNMRFKDIIRYGLPFSKVVSMYIYHEAPEEKFAEAADKIISKNRSEAPSPLQLMRKNRGMSQRELADASGVSLRMIQLYEQNQNDISKAQARMVAYLAHVLGCRIEDLIEMP